VVLRAGVKKDALMKARDEFLEMYSKHPMPTIKALVVQVMLSRAKALTEQDGEAKPERAIELYQQIVLQFKEESTAETLTKLAEVYNNLADRQLILAKKLWPDQRHRQAYLQGAYENLLLALPNIVASSRPFVLGNLAYCHFLQGREALARTTTIEALRLGGTALLAGLRKDAKTFRIEPEDSSYEKLLHSLEATTGHHITQ
jgi:hypothetical protein